ncbi:hypothetical protein [Paenirhodobacter sp.]|uniref:hypothetical protein n=1 Tax=Paenirhodobacter sp. TaxID=1965326 RepID=UPI003B3FE849
MIRASDQDDDDEDVIDASVDEDDEAPTAQAPKVTPSKPHRPAKTKVVEIQLDAAVSLAFYVDQYARLCCINRRLAEVSLSLDRLIPQPQ